MDSPLNQWIAQTRELRMDLTKSWIVTRLFQRRAESLRVWMQAAFTELSTKASVSIFN